eukprot:6199272-Amphidinium_carterae.1
MAPPLLHCGCQEQARDLLSNTRPSQLHGRGHTRNHTPSVGHRPCNNSTLIMIKLPDRVTSKRSPGPGPLLKADWLPIANQYLSGRNIVLNTDSAKAYDMEVEGVKHTSVRHSWKKVGGVWQKTTYAITEEGEELTVHKGTQTIDGLWKWLHLGCASIGGSDPDRIESLVRVAQWRYW